jgi:hypothetical protein
MGCVLACGPVPGAVSWRRRLHHAGGCDHLCDGGVSLRPARSHGRGRADAGGVRFERPFQLSSESVYAGAFHGLRGFDRTDDSWRALDPRARADRRAG